jgi:hypothetical protein
MRTAHDLIADYFRWKVLGIHDVGPKGNPTGRLAVDHGWMFPLIDTAAAIDRMGRALGRAHLVAFVKRWKVAMRQEELLQRVWTGSCSPGSGSELERLQRLLRASDADPVYRAAYDHVVDRVNATQRKAPGQCRGPRLGRGDSIR